MTDIYFDLMKLHQEGHDYLYMGGYVNESGEFFREKDVLEDDFSTPLITGICRITKATVWKRFHIIELNRKIILTLSETEYQAGIVLKA